VAVAAAVEAHAVEKQYGALVAVSDLSFTAEAGEVLGVLGRNGAGKTTSIRMLTTMAEPTRGTFAVAGVPHTRPAEIRRRIGVLPESGGYPGGQTGEEYLVFHARLHGRSRAGARAAARTLLDEFGLSDRAGAPISTYSLGMLRRLGIARALVNEPEVVFLDEPTLGLDPAGRRSVLAFVRGIARDRGAAVLLSTHLLDDVETSCSRVLILHHGRTIASGTVAEIARRAAAPRTALVYVDNSPRAVAALAGRAGVEAVHGREGWLRLVLATGSVDTAGRALLDGGVGLRGLELEGARLSDAFLAMTEAP
jgi:ABC-2 type transport system ATP-binding protein